MTKLPQDNIFKFNIDWQKVAENLSLRKSYDYFSQFGQTFFKYVI
jgi:hypothetical protein